MCALGLCFLNLGQAGFHTISRGVFFLDLCKCGLKRPGNPEDTLNDSR